MKRKTLLLFFVFFISSQTFQAKKTKKRKSGWSFSSLLSLRTLLVITNTRLLLLVCCTYCTVLYSIPLCKLRPARSWVLYSDWLGLKGGTLPRTWVLYSDWLDLKGGTLPKRTSSKEISVDRTTSVLSNVQPIVPISDRLSVVLGVNLFSRSLFVILIEEVT